MEDWEWAKRNNNENIVFLKARQCGFSAAIKAKIEADIKAGKNVYFGVDNAHGKDRTAEIVRLPDFPLRDTPNCIMTDHHGRYYIPGEKGDNPYVTKDEAREIVAFYKKMDRKLLSMPLFREKNFNDG
jgi:hypothetical protein